MDSMRILAVGDVVGEAGVAYIKDNLWGIRKKLRVSVVVANGENAAKGNGLDIASAKLLLGAGVDVITSGNHIWQKKEIYQFLDESACALRPANYPDGSPGQGYNILKFEGYNILFLNLSGNLFMDPGLSCPFALGERILERETGKFDFAVADFHAEATSEKIAFALHLDSLNAGRVSSRTAVVFGTHTHVQTSDACILPNGTGYITDTGMTGPRDSVLGVKSELAIKKFLTKMPVRFETSDSPVEFNGTLFEVSLTDFRAVSAEAVRIIGKRAPHENKI